MTQSLAFKVVTIIVLIVLLLIPLNMIHGLIAAREYRQTQVEQTIAESSARSQTLITPMLVVRYIEDVPGETWDETVKRYRKTVTPTERFAWFAPRDAQLEASTETEARYKGLYKAQVLKSQGRWKLRFDVPARFGSAAEAERLRAQSAHLVMGITDVRGITGTPKVRWGGEALTVIPGNEYSQSAPGLSAVVPAWLPLKAESIDATVDLTWLGTGALNFAPLGEHTRVSLRSPWPHPNFQGSFLPVERSIGANGFQATWDVTHYASQNESRLRAKKEDLEKFGVSFIEPVNVYLQAERAVKYGALFVCLTFAAFFLIEVLKGLRLHAVQYGLVGLALASFFLLIVSLSEHIAFMWAYLASATACITLLTYYLGHALRSFLRGFGFGLLFSVLYGALYVLLLSEDNALILGAGLLFAALATVMVLTRKVDWHRLERPGQSGEASPTESDAAVAA